MRALKRAPCPCDESAKTHTAPRRLRSAPTSRKHCGVCTVGERNADAPLAAGGSMVPRAPPAPSERQCANAALTGSGNISLPHIPRAPCRGNISTPCVPEERVVAIFRRDASPGCRPWQYFAVVRFRGGSSRGEIMPRCVPGRRSVAAFSPRCLFRALVDGKTLAKCVPPASDSGEISPRCVFGLPAMARFCCDAFPGCRPWQDLAAMRSRAAIRGSFFASCVPEGASDGKSASSWQHIAAVHPKRAGFGKICAPCIRKAPQTGVRGCTARISCQEGALFAARAPQIMHGAQILPSFGA